MFGGGEKEGLFAIKTQGVQGSEVYSLHIDPMTYRVASEHLQACLQQEDGTHIYVRTSTT